MNFLSHIIPSKWEEKIEVYPNCIVIRVLIGLEIVDHAYWLELMGKIENEFPDKVLKVFEPYGIFTLKPGEKENKVHIKEFTLFLNYKQTNEQV